MPVRGKQPLDAEDRRGPRVGVIWGGWDRHKHPRGEARGHLHHLHRALDRLVPSQRVTQEGSQLAVPRR